MNHSPPFFTALPRTVLWGRLAAVLAVSAVATSTQSFWIDEANTAWKAIQPTLAEWWKALLADRGSDLQMPLYMIFAWAWGKVFGTSELALRAANWPWFWLGMLALWRGLAGAPRLATGVAATVLCSPFAWYYLNDARPYAMQIGMSLAVLSALWRLAQASEARTERPWAWVLCGGVVALSGSSLLGMIFCGALLGAALLAAGWSRAWQGRAHWRCWGVMLASCLGLGAFYLWTLKLGAGAARGGGTDVRNVLFAGYELVGFSGLGPGRNEMRAGGLGVFRPYWPWLILYGAALAVVLAAGGRRWVGRVSHRTLLCWLVVVGAAAVFIFAVGVRTHFRVLGRHFSPLQPVVGIVLGGGLEALAARRGWYRWVAVTFVALALVSALELRFAARHSKDAYREVAALARAALARSESVWWMAEPRAAQVYHVPVTKTGDEPGKAWTISNPENNFAAGLVPPDWIFASKPDLYDVHGTLAEFVASGGYEKAATLPAFTVWRKPRR